MKSSFKLFQSRLLFLGLELEEKLSIEVAFSRYSVFYAPDLRRVASLNSFDLICLTEEMFRENQRGLAQSQVPFMIIGNNVVPEAFGHLPRPLVVREWIGRVQKVLSPVRTPEIGTIQVGSVVRSKTTPDFGKGVVIRIESEHEVLVKFPMNKLLPKGKALRCHISQLQLLGKIDQIDKKNSLNERRKSS